MIKNIVFLLLAIPLQVFAQDDSSFTLSASGLFFMIFAWVSIITWNLVCFKKLLKK